MAVQARYLFCLLSVDVCDDKLLSQTNYLTFAQYSAIQSLSVLGSEDWITEDRTLSTVNRTQN